MSKLEELKKTPDKELTDEDLGKVAGGKRGDLISAEEFTFTCPFCHAELKVGKWVYENETTFGMKNCWCGAAIKVYDTTVNCDFTKDGQTICVNGSVESTYPKK